MESTKEFSPLTISQATSILNRFWMIGFAERDLDAGQNQFIEQLSYPRDSSVSNLKYYAKQAIICLRISASELACAHENDLIRSSELLSQAEYLQKEFVDPQKHND